VLRFPYFTKPFKIHIDANDFAISGVFMHNGQPIAFENKKLYGAQLQWPILEKEL
jgi:polynucleotide 5'-kinase involved in rRNA processing